MRKLFIVAFALIGVSALRAAEPGTHSSWPRLSDLWKSRDCWCPDDYARKSLPCVAPNAKGSVDDYCRKPMPCVGPDAKGCIDDYCRKDCPITIFPIVESWHRCPVGPDTGAAPCERCGKRH